MEDAHRLELLRRKNAERWSTLKELHQKCASTTPTADNQIAATALTSELETLQSTSRQHAPLDFTQEVVNSYDELRQTNALLKQRTERERIKLDSIKQMNVQYNSVNEALLSVQRNTHPHQDQKCSEDDNLQRENQWIRQELQHVAHQVTKRRRRLENDAAKKRKQNTWSLDRFVLRLMERYLASDPYVLVSSLPVEQWQVDFLCSCHVIRIHPDNPNLVCLSDYNGSYTS